MMVNLSLLPNPSHCTISRALISRYTPKGKTIESNSPLFQPFKIRHLELRNRLVMTGHGMSHAEQGMPAGRMRRYTVERAKGGAALVILPSAPVTSQSTANDRVIHVWKERIIPYYQKLSHDVHDAGAKVFQILWHAGHNIQPYMSYLPSVAPSPIPDVTTGHRPKPLEIHEIHAIVDAYAQSARRVQEGGLDGVEVQTAADYLLGSFLSPTLNQRTDQYGGSRENRMRIIIEILTAIREAVGDHFVVGVRTSMDHLMPIGDGLNLDEAKAIVTTLSSSGLADYISMITGSFYSIYNLVPPMAIPPGLTISQAREIRTVCTVPMIVTGRIRTPEQAATLISEGVTDMVGMARSFIADPEWVVKAQRGEGHRIRPCISCNQGCWGMIAKGRYGSCILNPEAGNERQFGVTLRRSRHRLKILVVGGGPAGIEAARVSAIRGHHVELAEESNHLGGQMRLASTVPERAEMADYLGWAEKELPFLGVNIRYQTRMDAADVLADKWDAVVLATGSTPAQTGYRRIIPNWTELPVNGTPILSYRDALENPTDLGRKILVVDEDHKHTAAGTVHALAEMGHEVVVATSALIFGYPELFQTLEWPLLYPRLIKLGVKFHTGCMVSKVSEGDAYVMDLATGITQQVGQFDTIVLATGNDPDDSLYRALISEVRNLHRIGDCVTPRGIFLATYEGNVVARSL